MGMGYGAGYAEVITENAIRKTCQKEFKDFMNTLKTSEVSLEDFAAFIATDREFFIENEDKVEEIQKNLATAWKRLQQAFHEKSKGLDLDLGFHDSDNEGDRYDEVNGAFWCVGGMYQLTKAGKKYQKSVERKFFVTFG